MRKVKLLLSAALFFMISCTNALYLTGRLHTKKDWEFLGRFCFLSDLGRLQFSFLYPYEECCHSILLYYDDRGQWDGVYKNESKNCFDKQALLQPQDHQIINLTSRYTWSGCMIINKTGTQFLECKGGRSFRTLYERWWYIAVSNCAAGARGATMDLEYEMKLTNGHSFWTEHFSADEFGILEMNIAFLIIYCLAFAHSCHIAVALCKRQMLHTTYKMFMSCLALEMFGLLMLCVALGTFATDGVGNEGIKISGKILGGCAELLFLLMLLLIAKGFTITRGQLSHSGSIKLAVFVTVYAVISVVLFLYEYVLSDPGLVLYVYESPAGYGIIALRMAAWFWFTYGIIFTLKHYPEKSGFYYRLYTFYSIWFFAVPIMVLIATFAIPKYMRSKIITALELCIDFLAYLVFLVLTRPGAANRNFPYHVRTSQIGIVKPDGKVQTIVDFPHSVYGNIEVPANGHRPASNFAELFTVQSPNALQNGSTVLASARYPRNSQFSTNTRQRNNDITLSQEEENLSRQNISETSFNPPPSYNELVCGDQNSNSLAPPVELFASKVQTAVASEDA